jgi:hypothetical protein
MPLSDGRESERREEMRKSRVLSYAAAVGLTALIAAGCSSQPVSGGDSGSAREFTALAGQGMELDYNPLVSPADALAKGDVVVQGKLVEVTDGITFGGTDKQVTGRSVGSYVTAVIEVDSAIKGNTATGTRVYAMLPMSTAVSAKDLAAVNKTPRVVAVLDDISDWTPAPGVQVVRPAAVPADVPMYIPYTDGLWLQGNSDQEMLGVHAEPNELASAWDQARTVDQYSSALRKAAGK